MEVYNPVQIPLDVPLDDAVIWRYVNLEKLLSLLQSSQLFFASLDGFDDAYEGSYPKNVWYQVFKRAFEKVGDKQKRQADFAEAVLRELLARQPA